MKVPPKRKGNGINHPFLSAVEDGALNESPSEKEGKCCESPGYE